MFAGVVLVLVLVLVEGNLLTQLTRHFPEDIAVKEKELETFSQLQDFLSASDTDESLYFKLVTLRTEKASRRCSHAYVRMIGHNTTCAMSHHQDRINSLL
jgi:hypothetical protein